ncbi:MAG: hypothetical protein QM817_33375 [Archangium sp.]
MLSLVVLLTAAQPFSPISLSAPADLELSAWTTLAPGVRIRFGSSPLAVQTSHTGTLRLSVDSYDAFTTRRMDSRWKCVPGEGSRWNVNENPDVLAVRVPVSSTVTFVPTLPVVARTTTRLRWQLTLVTGDVIDGTVSLATPLTLNAAEGRFLDDLRGVGPAALSRDGRTLHFVRVERDVCGDTQLRTLELSPSAGTPLIRNTEWELVRDGPWLYSRRPGASAFAEIRSENIVFLGFPYSLEESARTEDTVKLRVGEFSGCFGSNCGDPVSVRERTFLLQHDGHVIALP